MTDPVSEPRTDASTCPVCGAPVTTYSTDEGTHSVSYTPPSADGPISPARPGNRPSPWVDPLCNCPESGTSGSCPFHDPTTLSPARPVEPPDDRLGKYWHNPAGRVFCDAWTENGCAGHSLSRKVVDDALARDAQIARLTEALRLALAYLDSGDVRIGAAIRVLRAALASQPDIAARWRDFECSNAYCTDEHPHTQPDIAAGAPTE